MKYRSFICCGAIISGMLAGSTYSAAPTENAKNCAEVEETRNAGNVAILLRASTVLRFGQVVDPTIDPDRFAAIEKFQDIGSCLIMSGGETTADNLALDWSKISSLVDLDTCFFRVASSLGDAERTLNWLKFNGFEASGPYELPKNVMETSFHFVGLGQQVNGMMKRNNIKMDLGWFEKIGVDSLSISATFGDCDVLLHTQSSLSRI